MVEGDFSHQGELITFEVMARDFDLLDPAVIKIAELVHFIDVQEEAVLPDDAGLLKNIVDGLVSISTSDHQLMTNSLLVFDALYAAFSKKSVSKKAGVHRDASSTPTTSGCSNSPDCLVYITSWKQTSNYKRITLCLPMQNI